jgi:hypothetical protein
VDAVSTNKQGQPSWLAFFIGGAGVDEHPRCGLTARDTQSTRDARGAGPGGNAGNAGAIPSASKWLVRAFLFVLS